MSPKVAAGVTVFFVLVVQGLELVQQQFLLAKAEEMLQIILLLVNLEDVEQTQIGAAITQHD